MEEVDGIAELTKEVAKKWRMEGGNRTCEYRPCDRRRAYIIGEPACHLRRGA